ncbi:proliferation marker protein Ki-67 isoform X2 [Gadus morhua]|uniref:proliferation marker protein Ki-67 isoform X2 n=1 Tax=Gadus morhua TaxID=8049 RepID=UPI0011B6C9EB|nr:proliferation marker protein Ki-67 isoform X2 [Gadus morhua]
MPYGKIVVIKRGGGDGTEFPLTATCLFGRKQECDIRIQLPHVSKEHCRVELNENKEVILTNMSSVNPTRVNGEELQQAERLKHGDVITIIDRSFRFESPPQQTPKKSSVSGKADAQVLHEQLRTPGVNRTSEISTGPRLKDGANNDNIQRSLDKTMEVESKDDKTDSPFNELYQMIKHSLVTPRKPSGQQSQTPATKSGTPRSQPGLITKVVVQPAAATPDVVSIPSRDEIKSQVVAPAKSPKKQTPKTSLPAQETPKKTGLSLPAETPSTLEASAAPEEETTQDAIAEATCATPTRASVKPSPRVSPRSVEKSIKAHSLKKELAAKTAASEILAAKKREMEASASPMTMRKRVSFGGHLSPELFDKRLPPSSPLQKGATPRRSLSVARPKQSLLRRASAMGLVKEFDEVKSPKTKSPKAKTPSPAKKSPKVKAASPKAPSSAKKSPKAKSGTPSNDQSPTVNGRFSVSRINTPSPNAELETATPKLPLKRKSIARKSIARKTPKTALKNAAEVLRRRSGVSRASLKVVNSWVDIVKFGQTKPVVALCKGRAPPQKVKKAVVALPMTPAKKCPHGHVTTGHADSPVTIVVGKAFNQRAVQAAGAAPKLVQNIALLKKNMKVDQDLTGIAEIFTTPVNARKRKSDLMAKTSTETPATALSTSAVEMSVMNTPEETGEMVVSPMGVGSTTKRGTFNREAVQRLLQSEEGSSFVAEAPALDDAVQASSQVVDTKEATPKQKPAQRAAGTPKQKAEPIEDLRGNLLKTPKQKPQQPDGLSAVKRIMKTPRQKSEPMEDLRGKLLKTPRVQKVTGEINLEGVEQLLQTPKRREVPVSAVPEVVVQETRATPEETIAPVVEVEENLAAPLETIAPVEEVVVEETPLATPVETTAPVEETMVEETPLATPVETIAPVEEVVVEETPLATPEELVVEETIAPVVEVFVEETIAPVVEVVVEETIAPVVEVVVEETIAPVVEVVVEETIAPVVAEVIAVVLATPEETIAPVVEVVVVEALTTPEGNTAPIEELMVEETPVVADKPTENAEDGPEDAIEEVAQADMATELVSSDAPVAMETAPKEVVQDSALPAAAPLSKSLRGKKVKATKRVTNEDATVEELTTPARARPGRPAKKTPAPSQVEEQIPAKSRRGKLTGSQGVEAPIVTSLAEEAPEEAPLKPKRGRNAKPAPAADAVPEIATTEETGHQAPAADALKSDTTALPPPVKTPATRKGRTPKKVAEQPMAVPQPEEESVPAVKVAKPRRGRKAAQQEPQVGVIEEVSEGAADAQPEEPAPVTVKARRGRKAAPEPEVVAVEQVAAEQPTQAPVRAKRGRSIKAKPEEEAEVDIPVLPEADVKQLPEKSRRSKKTKQESVEEEVASEELQVVESSAPEKVKAPSKARGRKAKQQEEAEETPVELAVVAEVVEEPTAVPAEKPKRGRRPTKAEEPETVVPTTAEKPKRGGRRAKTVVIEEEVTELPEETVEPEPVQEEITESTSSSLAQQPEKVKATRGKRAAVTVPATAAVKRGRRGAVEPPQEEAVVVEEVAAVASRPAARGRAGKRGTVETADVPEEVPAEEEEEEKVQPKKGRVSKKTKSTPKDQESSSPLEDEVTVTPEIPTTALVVKATRGRKAAVAAAPEKAVPVVAAKRNVSKGQSKAEEEDLSVPVKRTRRGTKVL